MRQGSGNQYSVASESDLWRGILTPGRFLRSLKMINSLHCMDHCWGLSTEYLRRETSAKSQFKRKPWDSKLPILSPFLKSHSRCFHFHRIQILQFQLHLFIPISCTPNPPYASFSNSLQILAAIKPGSLNLRMHGHGTQATPETLTSGTFWTDRVLLFSNFHLRSTSKEGDHKNPIDGCQREQSKP